METIKTAFALIKKGGKVLLIQEGFHQAYGQWCLPGGHIDEGEGPEQAAKREAFEETGGLKIKIHGKLMVKTISNAEYQGRPEENGRTIEVSIFEAVPAEGDIDTDKLTEELDAKWFAIDEAMALPLRWKWLRELF